MKIDPKSTALPSIEEMRRYHEGTLDELRVREIEIMSLLDPFLADALEGYSEIPAFDQVPPARIVHTGGAPWWHFWGWIVGLVIVGALAIEHLGLSKRAEPDFATIKSLESAGNTPARRKDASVQSQETIEWEELSSGQQDRSAIRNGDRDKVSEDAVSEERRAITDSVEVRFIPMKGKNKGFALSSVKQKDPIVIKTRRSIINDFIRIGYYHVADYSLLRKNSWMPDPESKGHVPASLENRGSESMFDDLSSKQGYFEFLEQTLEYLTTRDFEKAEAGFRLVLTNYPEDVNGQFYLGLTLFQGGSFEEAMYCFEKARGNALSTFDEDAAYYLARALVSAGRLEDAASAYESIIATGGFYAGQAREELIVLKAKRVNESK